MDAEKRKNLAYILKAANYASSGHIEQAEDMLRTISRDDLSAEGLDLLARIELHKGNLGVAFKLWVEAFHRDSQVRSVRRAIGVLNTPWLICGLFKRIMFLSFIALIVFAIIFFFVVSQTLKETRFTLANMEAKAVAMPSNQSGTPLITPSDITHGKRYDQCASLQTNMGVDIDGCVVEVSGNCIVLRFEKGLFSHNAELADHALPILNKIADILVSMGLNKIMIEGHTDQMPLPEWSQYSSNYALGLERAAAVAEIFRPLLNVSEQNIVITSTGAKNPPYEGDDEDTMRKNRTVILYLHPVEEVLKDREANL